MLLESLPSARPITGAPPLVYCRCFRAQTSTTAHRIGFLPSAEALEDHANAKMLSSGVTFDHIPLGRELAFALIVHLGAALTTIDELAAKWCPLGADDTGLQLTITRVDCDDGDPAPVDAFLIVPLCPAILRSPGLRIALDWHRRSFDGALTRESGEITELSIRLQRSEAPAK